MATGEAALTPRERQVVGLLTDPSVSSKAEAARRLDLHPTTVGRHASKRRVENAVAARLARESDRSHGQVARYSRLLDRGFEALENAVGPSCQHCGRADLDMIELAAYVKVVGEARLNEIKVSDAIPPPMTDPGIAMAKERRRTGWAIRHGAWLLSGRGLLGWPPQQVALSPHDPLSGESCNQGATGQVTEP